MTEISSPQPAHAGDMLEPLIYAAIMHNGTPKTVADFERAAVRIAEMLNRRANRQAGGPNVDLRKIAERAGISMDLWDMGAASHAYSFGVNGITREHLEKFAALYGFACWNAALEANPPHLQGFVGRAIGSLFDDLDLLAALKDCIEHMEHSTPHGRAAYENALAFVARAKGAKA